MKMLRTPSFHRILALGGFPFPDFHCWYLVWSHAVDQCLPEEVGYEVSDQLQAGLLTSLPAAQRPHSITLHCVLRDPWPLTCTRSPVGSHVIFFLHLFPHFGRVYPPVTFWEGVHGRQFFMFVCLFLTCHVVDRVLLLWPGVRPEPLRWESRVQDIGPPETSQPHVISISKTSPRDLYLNAKTQLTQRPASSSAGCPMPNN